MLEAFIDESGTHKGSPTIAVAGWVAHHGFWKRFLSQWNEPDFHSKGNRCDPLKHGLYAAIVDSSLYGMVAWMKPEDYKDHCHPLLKSAIGNAYAVCTFDCVLGICKFGQKHNLGKIAFVIEDGQPNCHFIKEVLEGMKAKERLGIASVTTASKKDFVQLSTADFLSWARTSNAEWFRRLYESALVGEDYITAERMTRMSDDLSRRYGLVKREKQLLKRQRKQQRTFQSRPSPAPDFSVSSAATGSSGKSLTWILVSGQVGKFPFATTTDRLDAYVRSSRNRPALLSNGWLRR